MNVTRPASGVVSPHQHGACPPRFSICRSFPVRPVIHVHRQFRKSSLIDAWLAGAGSKTPTSWSLCAGHVDSVTVGPLSKGVMSTNGGVLARTEQCDVQVDQVRSGYSNQVFTDNPRGHENLSSPDVKGVSLTSTALLGNFGNIFQGHASVRGLLKIDNQDRIVALQSIDDKGPQQSHDGDVAPPSRSQFVYSAVFDGHGGSDTATYAAERLQQMVGADLGLWETLDACSSCWDLSSTASSSCSWDLVQDELLLQRWKEVFANLDTEILEHSRASGHVDGATALAGVHAGLFLFVANAGDCRAVLGRNGDAVRLTRDHRPDLQSERARIEAEGGKVRHLKGCWRVLLPNQDRTQAKICSTSRGLGDLDFKEQRLITCEPEVTSLMLMPHVDAFSIFASDGVWNFVEDQDAVDAVREVLEEYSRMSMPTNMKAAAEAAARKVVKLALDSGSVDDISVIVNVYDWLPERKPVSPSPADTVGSRMWQSG